MATQDLSFTFGAAVTTPRYKLMAADGTLGSAVNPLTAGFLINADTGEYFVPQVNVGSARGVHWYCDTAALAGLVQFYDANTDPGAGAYAATFTVTDGTDPIQNAVVRVTLGASTFTLTSNVSGQNTFSLNAGTYTVTVTASGYSFASTTRTVTGNETGTLVSSPLAMTQTAIPSPPADPTKGTIYGSLVSSDGSSVENITITATLVDADSYGGAFKLASGALIANVVTTLSESDGTWEIDLFGNDSITPAGTQWRITVPETKFNRLFTLAAASTADADATIV